MKESCVNSDVSIEIATHKKYQMPKHQMYIPLHVGAEGKVDEKGNILDLGYIKDNSGDNISTKNATFCELTGLYWAWKNLDSKFIGLVHYRRHFMLKKKTDDIYDNVLNEQETLDLIKHYKIVVPKKRKYYIETLKSHYAHTHYVEHLDATREIIEEKYPEYLKSFDKVMKHTYGYMFNMMIMEKSMLDKYCTWLFDILFELEKKKFDRELSFFQGRFYGRVSEIIFNVWLEYQLSCGQINKNEIKEIPYVYMEKIDWKRKINSFLKAKYSNTKYEGSF